MPKMQIDQSLIDKQVKKMEKIIDKKVEELDKENYNKYIDVYKTALRFLKSQPVLMYGGLAIHEIMPDDLKIYDPYTLPDIDVFTYKPREITEKLVAHMIKNGYDLTTYGEALHEGTLKIYSQGVQLADITYITKRAFTRLSRNSKMSSLGVRVVDPQYLRMSLHKMLAGSSIDRWAKVFKRLINFYKAYPPTPCAIMKVSDKSNRKFPEELIDALYEANVMTDAVFMGAREVSDIMEKDVDVLSGMPPVIALVSDVHKTAHQLCKNIKDFELESSSVYKADEQSPLPAHIFLTYKKKKVALLFEAMYCVSYNEYKGRRIASIHAIMYIYLAMLCSTYTHFEKMIDAIECVANALSLLQLNTLPSKRKLLQQFASECFGLNEGMATLRRARLLRKQK